MSGFFNWLAESSWQAILLIPLIVGTQWALRNRWTPEWRAALWWLLLARMCLPALPESPLSLFNWAPRSIAFVWNEDGGNGQEAASFQSKEVPIQPTDQSGARSNEIKPAVREEGESNVSQIALEKKRSKNRDMALGLSNPSDDPGWIKHVWMIWGAGLAVFWIWMATGILRIRGLRKGGYRAEGGEWKEILQDCIERSELSAPPELRISSEVESPMLIGWRRPVILISESIAQSFSKEELRHILLHEMAHVARKDILINWLSAILLSLHWLNPALWWALGRMRQDQEMAADALALNWEGVESKRDYGATLIRVFEARNQRLEMVPQVAGVGGTMKQMRRRVQELANKEVIIMRKSIVLIIGGSLSVLMLTNPLSSLSREDDAGEQGFNENSNTADGEETVGISQSEEEEDINQNESDLIDFNELMSKSLDRIKTKFNSEEKLYGRVIDLNGNPVSEADLAFKTHDSELILNADNKFEHYNIRIHSISDQDGRFKFNFSGNYLMEAVESYWEQEKNRLGPGFYRMPSTTKAPLAILVTHEVGFKFIYVEDFEYGMDIQLEPWAYLSGRFVLDPEFGKVTRVSLYSKLQPAFRNEVFDSFLLHSIDGGFENKIMPPGEFRMFIDESLKSGIQHSIDFRIQLEPGKPHDIGLINKGFAVSGNIRWEHPAGDHGFPTQAYRVRAVLLNESFSGLSYKHLDKNMEKVLSKFRNAKKTHSSTLNKSGDFCFRGMKPGYYQIQIITQLVNGFTDKNGNLLIIKIPNEISNADSGEYNIGEYVITSDGVDATNIK
jgi:beta-lactamase regulating signal transducer with metallopeptidase domain